jgi:hypothetical protein
VLASPKIDGIRAIIGNGAALSRSLKPIRNLFVQSVLGRAEFQGLDGELVVGDPNDPNCMQNTTSGVMREAGDARLHVLRVRQVGHGLGLHHPRRHGAGDRAGRRRRALRFLVGFPSRTRTSSTSTRRSASRTATRAS